MKDFDFDEHMRIKMTYSYFVKYGDSSVLNWYIKMYGLMKATPQYVIEDYEENKKENRRICIGSFIFIGFFILFLIA